MVVVGVPEETLPFTVDKDDIFWVGLSVAPTCGLGALCDVALSSCEEITTPDVISLFDEADETVEDVFTDLSLSRIVEDEEALKL